MPLTDTAVRQAKTTGKSYTIGDHDGLSLGVAPAGGKSWHFRYSWRGKQKRMSLGTYPEVSLREARALRDEARALIAKGINPRSHRKHKRVAAKLADEYTFHAVFEKWQAHRALRLTDGRNSSLAQAKRIFEKDVLPKLGKRSIYDIKRPDLLDVLAVVERRNALTMAKKIRNWFNQMFRYALVKVPDLEHNPAADLDVVAVPTAPVRHNPFLRVPELPECLQLLRNYPGRLRIQLGVRMLLLTGVRTGELRLAKPDQFRLDRGLWIIPPEVVKQLLTKMQRERLRPGDIPPYIVPLSLQAQEIVRYLLDEFKPAQVYLLHHEWDIKKTISENTLNAALKRIGFEGRLTGHGIRSTISTALHELGYPDNWLDAQLSHVDPNPVRATYNHAEYVEQRRWMMQDWADRLDLLEQGLVEQASQHLPFSQEGLHMLPAASSTPGPSILSPHTEAAALHKPSHLGSARSDAMVRSSAVRLPVSRLQADVSDAQRERMERLEIFNSPRTLPAAVFAKAAGKSRRWISYEIEQRNVLALYVGNLGQRVPDWHLDPLKHELIQSVLKLARDFDPWHIYSALSRPCNGLDGRSPIDSLTSANFSEVFRAVCVELRQHDRSLLRSA